MSILTLLVALDVDTVKYVYDHRGEWVQIHITKKYFLNACTHRITLLDSIAQPAWRFAIVVNDLNSSFFNNNGVRKMHGYFF